MNEDKKKTRPTGDAAGRAKRESHWTSGNSHNQNTIIEDRGQAGFVSRHLLSGKQNAISGQDLVTILNLKDLRELTQLIERERRDGLPICAATDQNCPGYYLADGPDELEQYIGSLSRRIHNISRTMTHLEDTLNRMVGQDRMAGW